VIPWLTRGHLVVVLGGVIVGGIMLYGREQRRRGAAEERARDAEKAAESNLKQRAAVLLANRKLADSIATIERGERERVERGRLATVRADSNARQRRERKAPPPDAPPTETIDYLRRQLADAELEILDRRRAYGEEKAAREEADRKARLISGQRDALRAQLDREAAVQEQLHAAIRDSHPSTFTAVRTATQWAAVGALTCLLLCPR
jgi:hypothetical protein